MFNNMKVFDFKMVRLEQHIESWQKQNIHDVSFLRVSSKLFFITVRNN